MPEYKIVSEKTGLMIIDMTNAFLAPGAPIMVPIGIGIIPGLKKLMGLARSRGIRVIYTTQCYHKDGCDLGLDPLFHVGREKPDELREGSWDVDFFKDIQPEPEDTIIVKPRFSAFIGTELELILRSQGIDTLIIGGVLTNVCCESTAREARMRDFKVVFLSDGTATREIPDTGWGKVTAAEMQRFTLAAMNCYFGQVATIDQVMKQISAARK
jgi:biuret amidohydrolase